MKLRGSFPHRMDALTDTTDKETNERTNGRPSLRWCLTPIEVRACGQASATTRMTCDWCNTQVYRPIAFGSQDELKREL